MLDVHIGFAPRTRVSVDVSAIQHTNLHAHPNVLEIVYVLRGSLQTRVSSETFDLDAGDYAVLNPADPHVHVGSPDNATAVLHFDLGAFRDVDPFSDSMMFACESFDLPRYRRQEALLRGLLLDTVEAVDSAEADKPAADLIQRLCGGYSLADYYQRDRPLTATARQRFLSIMAYVQTHLESRDLLDEVAREHHYSKSYVSHFVKDSAAIGFSNAVNAARVMRAERLLLTTEYTMRDVSARCGFSDVKYFTRCFADWFSQTPADYRAANRAAIHRDNEVEPVTAELTTSLIREHRRRVASPTDTPRLSITPLLVKNIGSRADLFDKVSKFQTGHHHAAETPTAVDTGRRPHLLPMRIGHTELENGVMSRGLASFSDSGMTPCVVVEYTGKHSTATLLEALAQQMRDVGLDAVPMWLVYSGVHARGAVDDVIDDAHRRHGLDIQAVLTG